MRNPEHDIVVHVEPLDERIYGGRLIKTPFLRGLVLLWDALGLGIKSLMFAADVALDEGDGNGEGDEPAGVQHTGADRHHFAFADAGNRAVFVLPAIVVVW